MSIINLLRFEEGCRLTPYKCTAGVWSIGYGYTHGITADSPAITKEQALDQLKKEVDKCIDDVAKALPWSSELDAPRRDVLVAMRYQMGLNGLLGFHNFLRNMRDGDWLGASQSLQDSKFYQQTTARAQRIIFIVLHGAYPEVYK